MGRQALHIFLKDSRQFRWPIGIVLGWTLLFALAGMRMRLSTISPGPAWTYDVMLWSGYLFPMMWGVLLALAVHEEAMTGARQFWVTRPYRRSSLACAKALFVLTYFVVPFAMAQEAIALAHGFTIAASLPGLVTEQALIVLVVLVPAAAIAAVTPSVPAFVFASIPVTLWLALTSGSSRWGGVEWIRFGAAAIGLAMVAGTVLTLQYARRSTAGARAVAIAGGLTLAVAVPFLPWTSAFAMQSQLARGWDGHLDAALEPRPAQPRPAPGERTALQLYFKMTGLAPRTAVVCEAIAVTVEGSGTRWDSGPVLGVHSAVENATCPMGLPVPRSVVDTIADARTTIRAELYLTVLGPDRSIVVGTAPVIVDGAGLCRAEIGERTEVLCLDLFRDPRAGVFGSSVESYSPLPADLQFEPLVPHRYFYGPQRTPAVTIPTRVPVAHVRVPVVAMGVHLPDYLMQ